MLTGWYKKPAFAYFHFDGLIKLSKIFNLIENFLHRPNWFKLWTHHHNLCFIPICNIFISFWVKCWFYHTLSSSDQRNHYLVKIQIKMAMTSHWHHAALGSLLMWTECEMDHHFHRRQHQNLLLHSQISLLSYWEVLQLD